MIPKPTISFACYTIRVKDESDLLRKPLLGNFNRKDSLVNVLHEHLKRLDVGSDDGYNQKFSRASRLDLDVPTLKGVLETGHYGTRSTIMNATSKKASYRTKTDDALLIPLYFRFYLPEGENVGIMAIQRFKTHGIYDALTSYLIQEFKKDYGRDYRIEFAILTSPEILNRLIKDSEVREISFIQSSWKDDLADEIKGDARAKRGSVKVTISASYNSSLPMKQRIQKLFDGKLKPNGLIELGNAGFNIEPDEVSVDLFLNGKRRVVRYSDNLDFRSIFDVTDNIDFGSDGYPTYDSLDREAESLLDTFTGDLYQGKIRDHYERD